MSKNQSNTEKILKLVDKFSVEDIPELHNILKDHMTKKVLAKSKEYSELAEKFQQYSESVNK